MIQRMSQFNIKTDGTDSHSDYLDMRATRKENSRMELHSISLATKRRVVPSREMVNT